MKRFILFILFSLTYFLGCSQYTTFNPDTVCFQTPGSQYEVPPTPGYIYTWSVLSPGVIVSGQGTNTIEVNWSTAAPGLITNAISVTATNQNGCVSPPSTLDVFILQILPTIDSLGPFCDSEPCSPLIGTPPNGVFSGEGVIGNIFCPTIPNPGIIPVTYAVTQQECTETTVYNITVNPTPTLDQIPNQNIELCDEPQTITYLSSADIPGVTEWFFDTQSYLNNSLQLTWSDSGIFNVSAIYTSNGCVSDTMEFSVVVTKCDKLIYYIPNTFTPNGDEFNQTFKPIFTAGFDPNEFILKVFNRWGELIFVSKDPNEGWDGTFNGEIVPDGIYVWNVRFKSNHDAEIEAFTGHIILVR